MNDDGPLEILNMSTLDLSISRYYIPFIDSLMKFRVSEEVGSEIIIDAAASADIFDKLTILDPDFDRSLR